MSSEPDLSVSMDVLSGSDVDVPFLQTTLAWRLRRDEDDACKGGKMQYQALLRPLLTSKRLDNPIIF
jgi:hypothetical protein